jgi:Arc/MetJ family transcription regulator
MSMARTNIDIDEEACRRVMERFNLTTMKDVVNLALRTLAIEPMTLEEALAMRGTGWEGDLATMHTPRTAENN